MSRDIQQTDIKGIECRFAIHCPTPLGYSKDLHLVKEILHTNDGEKISRLRQVWDYKRSFYITKKGRQVHKDKKEWEEFEHLDEYKCTQTNLVPAIAKAIGEPWYKGTLRKLCRNPYIYGADILSTALIKHQYQKRYPNLQTLYTVATFDVETDVVRGTNEILMATLSCGKRIVTVVQESFLAGRLNPVEEINKRIIKYIGEYITKRNANVEIIIVDSEAKVILECFKRAHEWKPDYVAIWNIKFDMGKMLEACERAGLDPKDVFSDPDVPKEYRFFKFKMGSNQKVTASGKVTPIKPAAQWHTVYCPSSFYFIDAMCAFRHIRTGQAELQSYSLDNILNEVLDIRKLKFKEADKYVGLEWHQFMQEKYPFEYIVYNIFDCISMEELDEKTSDLSLTLPLLSKTSDFENFKSQPRRLVDDLHFFCLEADPKRVIATTSDELETDDDDITLGLNGWIITLPAHLVADNGLKIIKENPQLSSNIRVHVGDLDVAGSYPNGECVFNISKETTKKELCSIEGIDETTHRMQGINLSGGHSNSVEFVTTMFKLPTFENMLKHYQEQKQVINQ